MSKINNLKGSRIAIVGCGFIGRAWAISFARAQADVKLWDPTEGAADKTIEYISGVLEDLKSNGLLAGQSTADILSKISEARTLPEALEGAVYVQENSPEILATKKELFARLDTLAAPDTILASSTSALLPSLFTEGLAGANRCLVVHPINPPYLIPAAEVVPSPWTRPDVVEKARDILVAAGHAPLVMKKELEGFIMNRLQGALLEEAFRLVAGGYATVDDIDIGIRDGLALRWSFMGPFETMDLNAPGGVRDYATRYEPIYKMMFPQMQWRVDWQGDTMTAVEGQRRKSLTQQQLGSRQVWRDRRLMALAAHKKEADIEYGR